MSAIFKNVWNSKKSEISDGGVMSNWEFSPNFSVFFYDGSPQEIPEIFWLHQMKFITMIKFCFLFILFLFLFTFNWSLYRVRKTVKPSLETQWQFINDHWFISYCLVDGERNSLKPTDEYATAHYTVQNSQTNSLFYIRYFMY